MRYKLLINILLTTTLLLNMPLAARAGVDECKLAIENTVTNVMGSTDAGIVGYFGRLSDLVSTSMSTYLLIDEVQQLARDAKIELDGICGAVQSFEGMNEYYEVVYGLNSCKNLGTAESSARSEVVAKCDELSEKKLDTFLETLQQYLLEQAIRTSIEPLVVRMRSLNERLIMLVSEYSRLVNNFYTFSLRLGDRITGEWD